MGTILMQNDVYQPETRAAVIALIETDDGIKQIVHAHFGHRHDLVSTKDIIDTIKLHAGAENRFRLVDFFGTVMEFECMPCESLKQRMMQAMRRV